MSEETHTEAHDDDHHHEHFIVPWKYYVINAIAITILMFLTVYAAEFDFGHTNGLNLVIALLIACAKTACIGAIFMGVWWNSPLVKVFATCAIVWLLIMFSFMLVDYASPKWGLGTPYLDYEEPGRPVLPGQDSAQIITDMSEFGHHGEEGDHGADHVDDAHEGDHAEGDEDH